MKKSELRKLIREVISEQSGPSGPLAPMFADMGGYVQLSCPPGYRFQDNLPSGTGAPGGSSPQVLIGNASISNQYTGFEQTPFMPTERLVSSKCVPMNTIDADDLSPNPNPGIPIGKPGMEGGTKIPMKGDRPTPTQGRKR